MSQESNLQLIDEARDWAEECAGTTLGAMLESDLRHNDLDGMHAHVHEARQHHAYLDTIREAER